MQKYDEIIVEAGGANHQYWRDIWRYRDLLWILCRRDLSVRYKQTVIGVIWALARPLMTVVTFTVLLGKVASLPSEPGIPYSVMVFSGLMIWGFFDQCFQSVSKSLLANSSLVSKVYLPRLILAVSGIAVAFVDFMVSAVLLFILLFWFGTVPAVQIVLLPFLLCLCAVLAVGPGIVLAAYSLPYRDIVYITPLIVQIGMYVSPVVYTSSLVPAEWHWLYVLNPMVGIIDGFRWVILGTPVFPGHALLITVLWAAVLLVWGIKVFRNMERTFVDVL